MADEREEGSHVQQEVTYVSAACCSAYGSTSAAGSMGGPSILGLAAAALLGFAVGGATDFSGNGGTFGGGGASGDF